MLQPFRLQILLGKATRTMQAESLPAYCFTEIAGDEGLGDEVVKFPHRRFFQIFAIVGASAFLAVLLIVLTIGMSRPSGTTAIKGREVQQIRQQNDVAAHADRRER
ncbi:hypothetical protein JYU14_00235 [Simkania negevensis]|uniref:Uncharacterized protein n=1 Tax=Simkania negevensis TaxID=83561 RepID=A0ABS3APW3_9BACT|nr:hypothetical protein [Simkania negevensis]